MNRNIRIARELVRIARTLIASHENFGHYSIDFDSGKRTFTVYFILKEDAVESDALKNAKACRYEIKSILEKDDLIEVTNLENNHRSFCFTIVVGEEEEEEKEDVKKSSFNGTRVLVADGEEEGGDDAGGGDDSGDDEGGMDLSDSGDDSGDEEGDSEEKKSEVSPEDEKRFKNINDCVSKICKKYNWDTKK